MGNLSGENVGQQTPGQMIKAAREAKQISIGEVAQSLLLSKHTLIALENDDYSSITAEVYAVGYLKAYAKFLQIPVENILAGFHLLKLYSNVDLKSEIKTGDDSSGCSWLKDQRILLGILIFLILSMLLVAVKRINKGTEAISSSQTQDATYSSSDSDTGHLPIVTTEVADGRDSVSSETAKNSEDHVVSESVDTRDHVKQQ